ncbi:MAG TPA: hypothetical protein VJJ20_03785 [Candidatus Paceibacterota bacterium]
MISRTNFAALGGVCIGLISLLWIAEPSAIPALTQKVSAAAVAHAGTAPQCTQDSEIYFVSCGGIY